MPWHTEAMKDVIRCDKRWRAANKLWPNDFRMGKPTLTDPDILSSSEGFISRFVLGIINWIHRLIKQTRGTETSKYPEEKTSTEIPLVAASESGSGQWSFLIQQKCLERHTLAGDSPVCVMLDLILE